MNGTIRYTFGLYMIVLASFMGCRKDLCYDHDREVDLRLEVAYSLDWYLSWEENWEENWPEEWIVDWDKILPKEPAGVRLHTFDNELKVPVSNHNLESRGGRIAINSGRYDLLLYNNDSEGILFENIEGVENASATTRTRTRSTYSTRYPNEVTVSLPDVLFAGFVPEFELEKPRDGEMLYRKIDVGLTPRTWTYLVRYEFTSGQEFLAGAEAYLSGMAGSVRLNDGYTHDNNIVTLLLDCSSSTYGVESVVRSFGLPGFDYPGVKQGIVSEAMASSKVASANKLVLAMKFLSGRTKTLEFDVTDQVRRQPRGGVIVVRGIIVTPEEGEGPSSEGGGFEGNVNDWEENIDVDIPIL